MANAEFVRKLMMDVIADDYEHITIITEDVFRWAAEENETVTPDQIRHALQDLVRDHLAGAYRLTATPDPPQAMTRIPSISEMDDDDLYFYLTPEGKLLLPSIDE